jgi:hypothetical protein
MRKPRTITLLIVGLALCLASGLFARPTRMLRPVYTSSGEIMRRPDGSRMFEHDVLAQLRHDWLPNLMIVVGVLCLAWSAVRGVRFLYDRSRNRAA